MARRDPSRLLAVVAHPNDRCLFTATVTFHEGFDPRDIIDIETCCWLVEQQCFRSDREEPRERETLALARGQPVHVKAENVATKSERLKLIAFISSGKVRRHVVRPPRALRRKHADTPAPRWRGRRCAQRSIEAHASLVGVEVREHS